MATTYDRIAPKYDAMRFLWHEIIGREPFDYLRNLLKQHVSEGASVLDAGAGTGESIKVLLQVARPASIIGVDISEKMLDIARKKITNDRVQFQQADITHLPFPDRSFDVVMSSWAIETLQNPRAAVQEFVRVIKDDGYVIYVFSSLPPGLWRFLAFAIQKFLGKTFDWHFLDKKERPYHSCEHSRLTTFANGLATVIVLRKCCDVTDEIAVCKLPERWKKRKLNSNSVTQNLQSEQKVL